MTTKIKDMSLPTIVHKNCILCNKKFSIKRKFIWNGGGKYCSKECRAIGVSIIRSLNAQKNRIEKQCKVCNTYIYVKKSHSNSEGTYCSKECMSKDYQSILLGDKNPNFKNKNTGTKEYQRNQNYIRRIVKNPNILNANTILEKDLIYLKSKADKCYWCGKKLNEKYHYDHYIPLSKGGDNSINNIVISCSFCNHSKHAKDPITFANSIGKLL
jgi:hypothetical protein